MLDGFEEDGLLLLPDEELPVAAEELLLRTVSRRAVAVAGKRFWLVALWVVAKGVVEDNPVATLLPLLGGAAALLPDDGGGPSAHEAKMKTTKKHKDNKFII